jgi:hypothetical protein
MPKSEMNDLIQKLFTVAAAFMRSRGYPLPKLYPPASEKDIKAAERKRKMEFPEVYRDFLRLHNGFDGFWGDCSLIGVQGAHTTKALKFVKMLVEIDADERELTNEKAIKQYEAEGEFYLPNYLIFGTDFIRSIFFFNPRKKTRDGEMEVVLWSPEGSPFTRYKSFVAIINAAIADQTKRLKSRVKGKGKAKRT